MIEPTNLKLPSSLIPSLQKPLGTFVKVEANQPPPEKRVVQLLQPEVEHGNLIICVGDFVAKSLIEENFIPDLLIIDNLTQRTKKADFKIPFEHRILELENKPGEIASNAWNHIRNELLYLKKNRLNNTTDSNSTDSKSKRIISVIVIQGEEDLLALPTILEAPVGSFVLYGQPPMINDGSSGIVIIKVTEDIKSHINSLLSKFDYI